MSYGGVNAAAGSTSSRDSWGQRSVGKQTFTEPTLGWGSRFLSIPPGINCGREKQVVCGVEGSALPPPLVCQSLFRPQRPPASTDTPSRPFPRDEFQQSRGLPFPALRSLSNLFQRASRSPWVTALILLSSYLSGAHGARQVGPPLPEFPPWPKDIQMSVPCSFQK